MRRLCFGGSFNPIHNGHLLCARAAAEAGGYEQVVLIPCGQPPHKQQVANMAPAADRLAMCRLATAGDSFWAVDDLETRRAGPSYTIDTVRELRAIYGWTDIAWLIGADMARDLPHWHEIVQLLTIVQFVLMARPGWRFDWESMPVGFRHLRENVVHTPSVDISSTEIRRRVGARESIVGLVPRGVEDYIRERGLYR